MEREEGEKERGRKGEKRGWEGGRERPTDEWTEGGGTDGQREGRREEGRKGCNSTL